MVEGIRLGDVAVPRESEASAPASNPGTGSTLLGTALAGAVTVGVLKSADKAFGISKKDKRKAKKLRTRRTKNRPKSSRKKAASKNKKSRNFTDDWF